MQRDGFACVRCSADDKTLNVHHKVYRRGAAPWEYEGGELVTLCEECHEREHELRQASPLEHFECLLDAFVAAAIDRAHVIDEALRASRAEYFANPDPVFEAERARQLAELRRRQVN